MGTRLQFPTSLDRQEMKVCVIGLGAAGALFARDLVAAGAEVTAYDPARVSTPRGVKRLPHPALAARKAEMILAITPEPSAKLAMLQAIEIIEEGTLYADLSTSAPSVKADLLKAARLRRFEFADVVLMSGVTAAGLGTRSLAAGPGADRYAAEIGDLGGSAEVVEGAVGATATRLLLQASFVQGMAALVGESIQAATAAGELPWLWETVLAELSSADDSRLRELIEGQSNDDGSGVKQLASAHELFSQLDVEPIMVDAAARYLSQAPTVELPTP